MRGKHKTEKGSFLLELLVAFSIISVAMTVVVDTFITSQKSYRITAEQADLARALTRVLEDMTAQARVSERFQCGDVEPPCTGSTFFMTHIEGLNAQVAGEDVRYALNGTSIYKRYEVSTLPMTPDSVVVDNFRVDIERVSPREQARARITITAHEEGNPNNSIKLQTSFTERFY